MTKKLSDYIAPPKGNPIFWDKYDRPYYMVNNCSVYLSRKTPYHYSIQN